MGTDCHCVRLRPPIYFNILAKFARDGGKPTDVCTKFPPSLHPFMIFGVHQAVLRWHCMCMCVGGYKDFDGLGYKMGVKVRFFQESSSFLGKALVFGSLGC